MYCPKCKTGLKIKSASMIGKRITCPKCQKKIDVVTEDEDGNIPYGIETAPEPEPEPEPTEEELEQIALEKRKEKRKKTQKQTMHVLSILFYIALLGGVVWVFYEFVYKAYQNPEKKKAAAIVTVEPTA